MSSDTSPYLDKFDFIEINDKGPLPHWHQNEKAQFVTFRLGDSLPVSTRQELIMMRKDFLASHPLPWNDKTTLEFDKLISRRKEALLDNGYGSCILKRRDVRQCLKEVIDFLNNKHFIVYTYVIMPNHVHILMRLLENHSLFEVVKSIKRNSSRLINELLVQQGSIWMSSYFDRIIRNEDHFKYCVSYIRNNPRHLPNDFYELYVNPHILF